MRKTSKVLFLIMLTFITFILIPANAKGNEQELEFDIATSPHKVFFNLTNLKPGDKVTKTLSILNKGKTDFNYIFSNSFLNGSEKFYDQLLLKVTESDKTLYEGRLKDFHKIESRPLVSGTTEKLTFTVEIPYELGNDYQGLGCEFQFKLYVEGTMGGVLPIDGPKLPNTATGMFNLMVIGVVLMTGGIILYSLMNKKRRDVKPT